jgi:nitrite reductase (NADH) large subunit
MNAQPKKAWICPVCGYIHYGDEPPEECPVCGAAGTLFDPFTEAVPAAQSAAPVEHALKVVIIGAGIAGVSAAEAIRRSAPNAEITLVSNELELPYYRLNLTRYLAGEVPPDQLPLHPESWYSENQIHLLRGAEIIRLDLAEEQVALADGSLIDFDRLILTVGSRPFLPPFPGVQRKNISALRTFQQAQQLLQACQAGTQLIVIGGGLLGLEAAGALAKRGVKVTVLESEGWLLPRQLNQKAGELLVDYVRSIGIELITHARTRELVGDEVVRGVLLEDGRCLAAEQVLISTGVRSNLDLARQAGLTTNQGIVVDAGMCTSHADVFAAGDAAEFQGMLYGTWGPAQLQGSTAGLSALGQPAQFNRIPRSNKLKVLGYEMFSIGRVTPSDPADRCIEDLHGRNYACFLFNAGLLVGAILLGDISTSGKIKNAVENKQDYSTMLQNRPSGSDILAFFAEDLISA